MADDCGRCPALHAEINRLAAENGQLQQFIAQLREILATVLAIVGGAEALIRAESERQTMPRGRLIQAVHQRLLAALNEIAGR